VVNAQAFYKPPKTGTGEANLITGYRYWFNNEAATEVTLPTSVNPYELNKVFKLPDGLDEKATHTFSMQFCDTRGNWSVVNTKSFTIGWIEPVTEIKINIDVSVAIEAGKPVTLIGTVEPAGATNQNIIWSVVNAGTTGATITNGNVLNTTGAGTVVIRATITDGLGKGQDYVKDFTITVKAAFVAVTGITGIPATATAGTPLTLNGTVAPATATNKTIVWRVKTAGTTGATISGNTLNTNAAGMVVVTAAIVNGLTATTNYTQDFNIVVSAITGVVETLRATSLQAWVRDGLLHVAGLTADETLSIFNAAGALVYHSVATSGETDIHLAAPGVYIIRSGENTIKVSFNN